MRIGHSETREELLVRSPSPNPASRTPGVARNHDVYPMGESQRLRGGRRPEIVSKV